MCSARSEPDPQLQRIARAALWLFSIVVVAAAASGGGVRAVLGALAGGALAAVSYRAIRAGVDATAANVPGNEGTSLSGTRAWGLVKFVTRFAMLGGIAYVMMVRLRAQPGWMLLGASSLVVAAALEAVRAARPRS